MFSSHLMSPAREERSTLFPAFGKDSLLHGAIVSGEWRLITAVGWSGGRAGEELAQNHGHHCIEVQICSQ